MNEQSTEAGASLRFPFSEAPKPGMLIDVAPGVKWLRMPLPLMLDHINLWVLDDGDGWTLVDTGMNTAPTRALWDQLLAGPLSAKTVRRVICTHFHPDHFGLAGWLVEKLNVPLWVTDGEWEAARFARSMNADEFERLLLARDVRAGMAAQVEDAGAQGPGGYPVTVHALPPSHHAIDPRQPIEAGGTTWRVVVGEGHSPQLAALYSEERKVLISGDQVLPGISPNISVRPAEFDSNPLYEYLRTLPRFRDLPADTLVLPSHKLPFYGLPARVDQLIAHHHRRLALAKRACGSGATAAQVLAAMFPRQFDAKQIRFAIGETIAHLNYLIGTGDIVRDTLPDGIYRYRLA